MENRQQAESLIADFEAKLSELKALPRDADTFVVGWAKHGLFFDYGRRMACGLERATQFRAGESYRQLKNGSGEYAQPIAMPAAIDIACGALERSIQALRDAMVDQKQ